MVVTTVWGQPAEVIAAAAAAFGILVTLALGTIRGWRHKICFEYRADRDVATNLLQARFVDEAQAYVEAVFQADSESSASVDQIVAQPSQQATIERLAGTLREKNRLTRHFAHLDRTSYCALAVTWLTVVLIALSLLAFVVTVPAWLAITWGVALGLGVLGSLGSVSLLIFLDGRFFKIVNSIINPEAASQ